MLGKISGIPFLICMALGPAGETAWAQNQMGRMDGGRAYNPATEITVKGTVDEVNEFSQRGGARGIHVRLKTNQGTLDVRLGPSGFLAAKGLTVEKGDHIEVTGSKVTYNQVEAVLARVVKKGDTVVTLRDPDGVPLWAGAQSGMGPMPMGGGMGMGVGMRGGMARMGRSMNGPAGSTTGQQLFATHCAKCHYAESAEKKIGPGMTGLFRQQKLANGKPATDANIRAVIEDGAEGMPGYSKVLNKQQLDELIVYLKTL